MKRSETSTTWEFLSGKLEEYLVERTQWGCLSPFFERLFRVVYSRVHLLVYSLLPFSYAFPFVARGWSSEVVKEDTLAIRTIEASPEEIFFLSKLLPYSDVDVIAEYFKN